MGVVGKNIFRKLIIAINHPYFPPKIHHATYVTLVFFFYSFLFHTQYRPTLHVTPSWVRVTALEEVLMLVPDKTTLYCGLFTTKQQQTTIANTQLLKKRMVDETVGPWGWSGVLVWYYHSTLLWSTRENFGKISYFPWFNPKPCNLLWLGFKRFEIRHFLWYFLVLFYHSLGVKISYSLKASIYNNQKNIPSLWSPWKGYTEVLWAFGEI